MGATYPGELARSEQQVTYYKRHGGGSSSSSEANDLYTMMLNAQLEDTNKKFIRYVKAYPEPAVVVASEQQLLDTERLCCNSATFSVFTVFSGLNELLMMRWKYLMRLCATHLV